MGGSAGDAHEPDDLYRRRTGTIATRMMVLQPEWETGNEGEMTHVI